MIELTNTTASAIAAEFVRSRRRSGSPAMGMIMTVVVVVDEENAEETMTGSSLYCSATVAAAARSTPRSASAPGCPASARSSGSPAR
jgi:hypothetical protein